MLFHVLGESPAFDALLYAGTRIEVGVSRGRVVRYNAGCPDKLEFQVNNR